MFTVVLPMSRHAQIDKSSALVQIVHDCCPQFEGVTEACSRRLEQRYKNSEVHIALYLSCAQSSRHDLQHGTWYALQQIVQNEQDIL